jgi:hypothetical protein
MKRQIVVSPATLALGAGLAVAVLVIAVMATVMLTGAGDTSAPAQSALPTATSNPPPTAVPSASVTSTTAATGTPAPTATPVPPTEAATPTPIVAIVRATAALPPSPAPTEQVAQSPSSDYLKVVSKNFSGGSAASLTVEYRAYPRPGGQFYISATIWRTGGSECDATAITDIPTSGTVTITFPWARQAQGCSPDTFSSVYACLAFDGKETVCVNVYK